MPTGKSDCSVDLRVLICLCLQNSNKKVRHKLRSCFWEITFEHGSLIIKMDIIWWFIMFMHSLYVLKTKFTAASVGGLIYLTSTCSKFSPITRRYQRACTQIKNKYSFQGLVANQSITDHCLSFPPYLNLKPMTIKPRPSLVLTGSCFYVFYVFLD